MILKEQVDLKKLIDTKKNQQKRKIRIQSINGEGCIDW